MRLVSACLLGVLCRYDAKPRRISEKIRRLLEKGEVLIPVCPEQLGGFTTPRPKNFLTWNGENPRVINEEHRNVTIQFLKGAEETLKIARLFKIKKVLFKSESPSCGEDGVTTRLLREAGVDVEIIEAVKLGLDKT